MNTITNWIILILLLLPVLYIAIRDKKWYVYLLVGLAPILPEQFSLRLHDSLPLLTATRVLIIIAGIIWFVERIRSRKFTMPVSLAVFIGINLILSLLHLPSNFSEIKRIFLLIAERGLIVLFLKDMISGRDEFEKCVDMLILSCCAVAVIGICQTVFDVDLAKVLHLIATPTSVRLHSRMGLTRAFATSNALMYCSYCAMMSLLIYYKMENTGKKWYSVVFALNSVAMLATLSRSGWLCFLGTGALLLISRPKRVLQKLSPCVVMILVICVSLSLINPRFGTAVVENGKSCINVVLSKFGVTLAEVPGSDGVQAEVPGSDGAQAEVPESDGALELSEEYGANASDPAYSREFQWSALEYMADEGTLILGNGYQALLRGKVYFYRWGQYVNVNFIDVGAIALIVEYGLAGLTMQLGLLGYILVQSIRKRSRTTEFDFYKMMIFVVAMYLMLNVLSAYVNPSLVWLLFGLFYSKIEIDRGTKKMSSDVSSVTEIVV